MTQDELARRVGCSLSLIFKIETDERRPSRQMAELLATHLEIPAEQRPLFMQVARQEMAVTALDGLDSASDGVGRPNQPTGPATPSWSGNLPVFPTPLVGREHEIDIVLQQLRDPYCRMLTLTGPGGIGKTRLAVEVARQESAPAPGQLANGPRQGYQAQGTSAFPDGVYFLAMGSISQPAGLVPAIAGALGLVFSGPTDPKLQVLQALRGKKLLLLLDNMEHLISGSDLLGEILQQAPGVKLLLTSREQVNLQWEWIFEVQGLPVPEEASSQLLHANSAAALFLLRAHQAVPDLALNHEEVAALRRICKSVDGLPLAIELAASWVRVMSLSEIALELERSLDLLETSMQDIPTRHRSMNAVFDHSWRLLTSEEAQVLMKLSVFPDGFTRKAAEWVAGASLLRLSALVRKSLLRFDSQAGRYHFHELIRQLAQAQLHQQPEAEAQALEQLGLYYAHWLGELESALKSAPQVQTSARIRAETANWTAAWWWAVSNGRLELLRQMAPCLYWYFEIHGDFVGALTMYRHTICKMHEFGAPECLSTPRERTIFAFLVNQQGWFEFRNGNSQASLSLFSESHALAHQFADLAQPADQVAVYHIHVNWGYLALLNGDIVKARRMTQESLEIARALNSPWHIAIPVTMLGALEHLDGNAKEAYQQLSESLNLWRMVGDPRGLIFCMQFLSTAALALGDQETAEVLLNESLLIAVEKSDRWAQAFSLDLLGQVALAQGQPEDSVDRLEQSLALSQEIGDTFAATQTMIRLGEALSALGLYEEARHLCLQAWRQAHQAEWATMVIEALLAYLNIDQSLPVNTRISICRAIQAEVSIPLPIRQRAETMRSRMAVTQPDDGPPETPEDHKRPEVWAMEVFQKLETGLPALHDLRNASPTAR